MQAQYTINSKTELRRAIVSMQDDGTIVVNHYRRTTLQNRWTLDRICNPTAVWHVVLDQVSEIVNRPPEIGGRR